MGTVLAALEAGLDALPLTVALGKALWTDNLDFADDAVVGQVLAVTSLLPPCSPKPVRRGMPPPSPPTPRRQSRRRSSGCRAVWSETKYSGDRIGLDFVERALKAQQD